MSDSRDPDLQKNASTPAPKDFEKDQELASLKEKAALAEEAIRDKKDDGPNDTGKGKDQGKDKGKGKGKEKEKENREKRKEKEAMTDATHQDETSSESGGASQPNAPQANAPERQVFVMMKRDFALVLPFNDAALAVLFPYLFSGLC